MRYYVNQNAQPTGEHEVHTYLCSHGPAEHNRVYLGEYTNCRPAVTEARKYYTSVDGCYYCCNECNTG